MRDFERKKTIERVRESTENNNEPLNYSGSVPTDVLENILNKGEPLFEIPTASYIPSTVEKRAFTDAFGEKVVVLLHKNQVDTIYIKRGDKTYKYVLATVLDPPTADLYYHQKFTRKVYYYVPAGDEAKYALSPHIIPNTRYIIDFEDNCIYEYPIGYIQTGDVTKEEIQKILEHLKLKNSFKNYVL